jgi:hypothetical protein
MVNFTSSQTDSKQPSVEKLDPSFFGEGVLLLHGKGRKQ